MSRTETYFGRVLLRSMVPWGAFVGCVLTGTYVGTTAGWSSTTVLWLGSIVPAVLALAIIAKLAVTSRNGTFGDALRFLGLSTINGRQLSIAAVAAVPFLAMSVAFAEPGVERAWTCSFADLAEIVVVYALFHEVMFRGFVYRTFRNHLSLPQAAWLSVAVIAALNLTMMTGTWSEPVEVVVAGYLARMVLEIVWAFPAAMLFERGGNSIWGPVLLQIAFNLPRVCGVVSPHLPEIAARAAASLVAVGVLVAFTHGATKA